MEKLLISNTRLSQFRRMKTRLGDDFEKAITTHRAPYKLRVLTWILSKLVNVAMSVAGVFQKQTPGDLSLLEFELMALGYFMPLKSIIEFDAEVVRLSDKQKTILYEMHRAGLIDQLDLNHPLVVEYVHVVNEAEVLAQRVHAAYRRHVVLRVGV